jgi:hypothetical protein
MHELKHSLGGCKKIFAGAAFKKSDYCGGSGFLDSGIS